MRLFLISLALGVSFGGYIVIQYGPPELKTGISNFFGKWQDAFPSQAKEEQLPADPARRAETLINRLDSRLYELGRLTQLAENNKKEPAETSSNASQNKDSQETVAPEDKIINEFFKVVPSNPEEKIKIIISETRKLVEDLRETTNELKTSAASRGAGVTGPEQPVSSTGQTECKCSQ